MGKMREEGVVGTVLTQEEDKVVAVEIEVVGEEVEAEEVEEEAEEVNEMALEGEGGGVVGGRNLKILMNKLIYFNNFIVS